MREWLRRLWRWLNTPIGRRVVEEVVEEVAEHLPAVSTASVAKHVPRPGYAIIELYDAEQKLLAMDSLPVPPGDAAGNTITTVVVPAGSVEWTHWELECKPDEVPFSLPKHLTRSDAAICKIWWSRHEN